MALIARTQPVYAPPSIHSAQAAAGARYAAPAANAPVEELNPTQGAAFDDALTVDRENARQPGAGRQGRLTQPLVRMIVNATTQAFAALVEYQAQAPGQAAADGRQRLSARALSKAIATYETNARVISGTNYAPGATLSLSL
jgi:hypothetical protein